MSSEEPHQPGACDDLEDGFGSLDPRSYTAQRLEHASPEHLNLTTRRFFIGPIPAGWLNSNRKTWYRRSLSQREQQSNPLSFTASSVTAHQRSPTFRHGSTAQNEFSFPQPTDVYEEGYRSNSVAFPESSHTEDDGDVPYDMAGERSTQRSRDMATAAVEDVQSPKMLTVPARRGNTSSSVESVGNGNIEDETELSRSPAQASFVTARQRMDTDEPTSTTDPGLESQLSDYGSSEARQSIADHPPSTLQPEASQPEPADVSRGASLSAPASSTTALLPEDLSQAKSRPSIAPPSSLSVHQPVPVADGEFSPPPRTHTDGKGVRFAMVGGLSTGQDRFKRTIRGSQTKAVSAKARHNTLRDGTIVKMEKMLVRVEVTMQQLSDEYDENGSLSTQTRISEKWQEFMVVLRQSQQHGADFRLQMYKTRVIPEIEKEKAKKKPHLEIVLNRHTTRVNLYSSLDKTVVLWHPHKKGTRIVIMRTRSTAHSVEWYTLLKDTLGWARPAALQINVPDLSVSLRLEKPFENVEMARKSIGNAEDAAAVAHSIAEEEAVAGKMIRQCLDMLHSDPEWADVLDTWTKTEKLGLAWKRYDRLEWIHGANQRKMYGSMALQKSHELELRPKKHYPTHVQGKEAKCHDEPMPVEGFLIRLGTQKGVRQRLGLTSFKRLYFSTHDHFLVFNKPSKVTPPPPPRLATIAGTNIPTSSEIINATPAMFEISPYKISDGRLSWLKGTAVSVRDYDRKAVGESRRNLDNLGNCDGFINLCRVVKVRKMQWGAVPVDNSLDSGSDVDFHQEVRDTTREDGTTRTVDDRRTFELVMDSDLVVRLQAYDYAAMKEWIRRLRALVKYWKLRTVSDMNVFKMIRASNLKNLNVDEEMEALIGQFARKWEVARCEASPELYNMCGISSCRSIIMSGMLYQKARRRASFVRCSVILANGALTMFQATKRRVTGKQIPYTHQDKQESLDLSDCYIYSGLITQEDLLYSNRTFDSNHPGSYALPRLYLEHGWTSIDEDSMTCFVIWHGLRRSFFRAKRSTVQGGSTHKLTQVSRLGAPGRAVVFKCRSRAERDHWVMNVGMEIDRLQQGEDVRLER